MQFKKKITYSWIISTAAFLTAVLFPIIPCQKTPNIPNSTFVWKMCSLNPDQYLLEELKTYFFGYTPSILESYIIVLIVTFLLSFLIIHLITRKKKD